MNSFIESILKNRRKHDSKTFLIHILLFVISNLIHVLPSYYKILALRKDGTEKLLALNTVSAYINKALNIKSTFYQNIFFFTLLSTFQTLRRWFLTSQVRLGKHSHFKLLSLENNNEQTWGLH